MSRSTPSTLNPQLSSPHLLELNLNSDNQESLTGNNLPDSFTQTLRNTIQTLPFTTSQLHIHLKIPNEIQHDFQALQSILAKVYVTSEIIKTELKPSDSISVNVLIEGWSQTTCLDDGTIHNSPSNHYPTVALGGTFDHLHAGHKILLTMAAWLSTKRVIVGITDDSLLVSKQFKSELQPLSQRTQAVLDFLRLIGPTHLEIITPALHDVYGPTATDPDIHALLVSRETISGADSIDEVREAKGFKPLKRFVIDVIGPSQACLKHDQDLKDLKMSSTEIRRSLYHQRSSQEQKVP